MARSVGSASVSIVPDARGFVEKLKADLEAGTKDVGAAVGQNIGSAMREAITPYIDEIKLKIDQLGSKDVTVRVKVDDGGSIARTEASLAAVDASAASGGNGFSLFGAKIAGIGVLAVTAADVAIPAILAIGAAAAGALAGVAVLGLGFDGIGAALQAHGQKSPGGGTGVSGAALGEASAKIAAAQATQSAQDQLTQATQAQTKAEKDLHDARVQALQDLQDLDNKLKDNTLSREQAAINLKIAQQTLAVDLNAPGATQAQYANTIAQAKLNVAAAQQKVNELTLEGTRLSSEDAKAHKNGVNGAPSVVSAQQALLDANHKLAEAQANIGITAQKNAIALAQAANSMTAAAAGANSFGQAMSKLNPIQQQFVEFILHLKPLFDELKLAASQFLPGLEKGISNALPAFGPLLQIVGNVAKAMGTVFGEIGAQFASGPGKQFLQFLSVELPKQILFLGGMFIDFGKIVSGIFEAAGPLIDAFDQAFLGVLTSLGTAANGGGLKKFFDSLVPLIQPTFKALGAISGLIGSLLKGLAPIVGPVLTLIAKAFTAITTALAPLIPLFVQMIQQILPPLETLFEAVVNQALVPFIDALIKQIAPIMPTLISAFNDFVKAVIPLIAPIGQILVALTPLVPLFVQLTLGPLKAITPLIKDLTPVITELSKIIVDVLGPAISGMNDLFNGTQRIVSNVFGSIGRVISSALSGVITVFKNITGPLTSAFADVWSGIQLIWSDVVGFFKSIANGVIDVINGLISIIDSVHIHIPKLHIPGTDVNFGGENIGFDIPSIPPIRASGGPVLAGMTYKVNEFGPEMFIPKTDGTLLSAVQSGHVQRHMHNGAKNFNFQVYGQSDPNATAHATANRFAARGV